MEVTPRCRLALNYAGESLSRFGHSHVSSAHLVLGLLTLTGGVAGNVLRKQGLSVQSVESYLSSRQSSSEESKVHEGIVFGMSALLVFERAKADARIRHNTYLGIEHLLLGILAEENGEAADLFAALHLDRDRIKQIIVGEMQ